MKKFLTLAIMAVLAMASVNAVADDKEDSKDRERRLEELKQYKKEFLIKEVELTDKQQKEFLPLYAQMRDEMFQVNKDAREAAQKVSKADNPSDADYEAAYQKMLSVKQREAQIEKSYYERFAKILSKKQLFLLQRAESRFSRHVLKHNRRPGPDAKQAQKVKPQRDAKERPRR